MLTVFLACSRLHLVTIYVSALEDTQIWTDCLKFFVPLRQVSLDQRFHGCMLAGTGLRPPEKFETKMVKALVDRCLYCKALINILSCHRVETEYLMSYMFQFHPSCVLCNNYSLLALARLAGFIYHSISINPALSVHAILSSACNTFPHISSLL